MQNLRYYLVFHTVDRQGDLRPLALSCHDFCNLYILNMSALKYIYSLPNFFHCNTFFSSPQQIQYLQNFEIENGLIYIKMQ